MLIRVLIAVVGVVIANALLLPVSHLVGFPLTADLLIVARVSIAGLAVFYILKG